MLLAVVTTFLAPAPENCAPERQASSFPRATQIAGIRAESCQLSGWRPRHAHMRWLACGHHAWLLLQVVALLPCCPCACEAGNVM